jgi:uncharacterized protein involved in response to NO
MAKSPIWNAAFRPLFILAALAGTILPLAWLGVLHGLWTPPASNPALAGLSAVQWHAHEMYFGFGSAVLIGFLLTASKNWVGITGYKGYSLLFLSLSWGLERASMNLAGAWPMPVFWLFNLSFITAGVTMVLHTLLAHRAKDSYRTDNLFFLIALPLLLPAKVLLLIPETFASGVQMTQGVFRLAFLLMLERTVGTFLKNSLQLEITRQPKVDRSIKSLAWLLCFSAWLPDFLVTGIEILTASLLLWRIKSWHIRQALSRLEIGIMYLGYLALTIQLIIASGVRLSAWQALGSVSVHLFTLGTMGCIAPAMFIRIAYGHTGRKIVFGTIEKSILWLMVLATFSRTLMPQFLPTHYLQWLDIAATAWAIAFTLWLWRFSVFLCSPRVDGKAG